MNIGIDLRPLMDGQRTGVGESMVGLLTALFAIDTSNQYYLFVNSWNDTTKDVQLWEQENVHYIYRRFPNKLLSFLIILCRWPRLDTLVGQSLDVWFSPNIHFTSLSKSIRHIQMMHDLSFVDFPSCYSLKRRVWHALLRPKMQCQRADTIIVPSLASAEDVIATYEIEQCCVHVIPPSVERKDVHVEMDLPEKYLLYIGTLEPRKNIESAIAAFEDSGLEEQGYRFIIAGKKGWKSQPILRAIEQTSGVSYLGYVSEEEKWHLYKKATAFVFPSIYEGFGLPVLEAMASGLPVITSTRSSLPEVAGDAAHYVDPTNIADITNAMQPIVSDNKLRNIYIERGKKRAKEFSWKQSAQTFLSLINNTGMKQQPRVGIGVMIERDGKVLLGKRKNSHGNGDWAFPGGHLEFGESWKACAIREVAEETGLQVTSTTFITTTNDIFEDEGKHYVTIFMKVTVDEGKPQVLEPEKCEVWEWFALGDLPENIFLSTKNFLAQL